MAQAIVRTLAKWEALQTQAQAIELLALVSCSAFSPDEWKSPPLDRLARLSPTAQAHLERSGNNLPLQFTSFIGRERELAEVGELLTHTRLLTITGPGGMGKTRFATEIAAGLLDQYQDGCWLVNFAPITDGNLVVSTVAQALGMREEAGRPITDTLTDHLRSRKLLLVLDNCEHLLEACASLVKALLSSCLNLRILATSREALGIAGGTEWRLSPLSLPTANLHFSIEQMHSYEAVQLFVARAQAAHPGFALGAKNAEAIGQICRQLDGIPLAIELAAALVNAVSVEQIANRLYDRFRLLRSSDPTIPNRQQTLKASLAWSYDLLSEAERTLFRRLSVFAGGWSLEAAEVICADADMGDKGLQSEDVLAYHVQLVNKSLVQTGEQEGALHYSMLETVLQFAAERLTGSGEEHDVRRRHAGLYLALVEQAEPELRTSQQVEWLARLEREHDNIRTALRWLMNNEPEAALRLVGAQWHFWLSRGHISEGHRYLEMVLAQSGSVASRARAKALQGLAVMTFEQGDIAAARSLHAANLVLLRELKYDRGIAETLFNLGIVLFYQGDFRAAGSHFEQFIALERELGDRWGMAMGLSRLSTVAYVQGDHTAASIYVEEGMSIAREVGGKLLLAQLLIFRGERARVAGDYATAQEAFEECLSISRALGDKVWAAAALVGLGRVARGTGDSRTAHSFFTEAILTQRETEERMWVAPYLDAFAYLAVTHGQARQAVRLLGAAAALREALGSSLKPFEREEHEGSAELARKQLDQVEFEEAWAEGRRMSPEEAIEAALNVPVPGESIVLH
jgi:non-specific serine/threonine protein kinase